MSHNHSDPNEEVSRFIDTCMADLATRDFGKYDVSEIREALESRLYDAWEHGRDTERQALLKLKESLLSYQEALLQELESKLEQQPVTETDTGIKHFQTLSQAVAYIAELIERNSASALMAQFAHIQHPHLTEPYYSDSFNNSIFPQLRKCHQEMDLRTRYWGKRFPANEARFTLGGHMKELGCIHIKFMKQEQGWVLDDIFECR